MVISQTRAKLPNIVEPERFGRICGDNLPLIASFHYCIRSIKEHLTGDYLFLLTNVEGILLTMDHSRNLARTMQQSPIRPGMCFSEQSCGVNAISEAMAGGESVYLTPMEHESPLFQSWHCFAKPLTLGSETIGYLDVSTIASDMKSELIAIAKLIPAQMLDDYRQRLARETRETDKELLTERQLHVLRLIAQGETVKSIAIKLQIKECTVNHHKKVIFEKLGVQSSTEAVSIASKLKYL